MGHWLSLRLEPASGRSAEGAEVTIQAGGRRWFRRATTGGSYLSASDPRVHFGLGDVTRMDRVEVRWPDGSRLTLTNVPVNRDVRVVQE